MIELLELNVFLFDGYQNPEMERYLVFSDFQNKCENTLFCSVEMKPTRLQGTFYQLY